MFDAEKFLEDNRIEHRNIYEGWLEINCPFCDDPSFHGGFHLEKSYYSCFRCKYHWIVDAIATLVHVDRREARNIIHKYSQGERVIRIRDKLPKKVITDVRLPMGCGRMTDMHRDYLRKRGFDDRKLEREWGLMGTKNYGAYKFRIIAPVHLNKEMVCYQGRDITDRAKERYKASPENESIINIKDTLYAIDKVEGDTCVVVEGIVDVWRLGRGAVSTFGIDYTKAQVILLARRFKTVLILFDNVSEALEAGTKLANHLEYINTCTHAEIVTIEAYKDSAEMSDREAKEVMSTLLQ